VLALGAVSDSGGWFLEMMPKILLYAPPQKKIQQCSQIMFFVDRGHDTCLRNVLRGSLRVTKNHLVAYQSLLVTVLFQFDPIHDEQTKPFLR
jgi:hypothetical protein